MERILIFVTCALLPLVTLLGYGLALCLFRNRKEHKERKHYN